MSNKEDDNKPDEQRNATDNAAAESAEGGSAEQPKSTVSAGDDVQQLQNENAELKDRILRAQAELENFRRRSQKEALDAMKYQAMPVIRDLLPGIDNLKRAIDAAQQSGDTQNLIEGITMVAQQFSDMLKSHSCEAIDPEGEPFDANFHEALTQVPSADHPPMTVIQVIETGYKIHDRVIRPAKVMVSCAVPDPAPETESSDG